MVVVALALLAGCSKSGSYFPLEPQLAWQYSVTAQRRDGEDTVGAPRRAESSMRTLPRRALGGREVTPQSVEIAGQFATIFRVEDKEGVHVVATQAADETEPQLKSGHFDIRFPLMVGRTWDDTSESVFLKESVDVIGESRIEAIDDVVTVPAGTYDECVRVRFTTVDGRLPSSLGGGPLTITSLRWFAPGVGMVKYQHDDRSAVGAGTFTVELQSFKQL